MTCIEDLATKHSLTYEVMRKRFGISETAGTYKTYTRALPRFQKVYAESKHASIDLVVRDGTGKPLFRKSLIDLDALDGSTVYRDLYGWFGNPSVYNPDYAQGEDGGYEFYSPPSKGFKI